MSPSQPAEVDANSQSIKSLGHVDAVNSIGSGEDLDVGGGSTVEEGGVVLAHSGDVLERDGRGVAGARDLGDESESREYLKRTGKRAGATAGARLQAEG